MGHKILLADDSITIQKVIELTFSDEDFELHTVGNGQKAIDEIRGIMPHIVLCDIIMPEKNGYEVCEFIKTNADLKHIPVLLLTGAFEPFDQERARNAGCDGFLAKPFEPQTLISKVKELLSRAPAAAPTPAPAPAAAPPRSRPAAPTAPRATATPGMPGMPGVEDRTVLMPPSGMGASPAPPRGPQVTAAAPPPPPPVADFGPGLDEAFAVEAGERELMMDPGDHTVLLGGRESAPAAAVPANDDIWGEVVPGPPSDEDADSSTVFMAPPPLAQPPVSQAPPPPAQSYNEIQYEVEDLDATWRMQGSDSAPASDYSGFEEFAEPPEADTMASSPAHVPPVPMFSEAEPEPMLEMPPPLSPPPPPVAAPAEFEPHDPFTAAAGLGTAQAPSMRSSSAFDTPHPFDSDVTLDSAVGEDRFEPIGGAASFEAYEEPEIVASPSPVEAPPPASSAWNDEAVFTHAPAPDAPDEPHDFDEVEAAIPAMASMDAIEDYEPASFEPNTPSSGNSSVAIDDALIDKLAQRVVDKLSSKVIQEIAWEVVPDLAEGLIRKEIEALKAKIPK
jgi:CheY-like chemotaxis protein